MAESYCLRLPDSIIADVYSKKQSSFNRQKFFFQKRFSSSDHLIVITRNINIYFDCIVARIWRAKNDIETVVFS